MPSYNFSINGILWVRQSDYLRVGGVTPVVPFYNVQTTIEPLTYHLGGAIRCFGHVSSASYAFLVVFNITFYGRWVWSHDVNSISPFFPLWQKMIDGNVPPKLRLGSL